MAGWSLKKDGDGHCRTRQERKSIYRRRSQRQTTDPGRTGKKNDSGPTRWPDRRTSRSSQRDFFLGRRSFVDLASAEVRLFGWVIILPVVSPNPRKTESDEAN